jgi:hypothetical protein
VLGDTLNRPGEKMNFKLRSNFHTSARCTVKVEPEHFLSDGQVAKVNKQLCMQGCECGGIYDAYVESPSGYELKRDDEGDYCISKK